MANVLVVDDSLTVREIVSLVLRAAGHEVVAAVDGEAALALVGRSPPEVVICDLTLPGMSGIDLVRELKDRLPQVPVLILTECNDVSFCALAMREGACGYLLKSTPHELLIGEVAGALETRRLRQLNDELTQANFRYQAELEALVDEKTREVLALQRARSQAERLEAMGTLVAGVAHEINNPLAAARTNVAFALDVLREGARMRQEDFDELPDVMRETLQSIDRIATLVKAFRKLSRPSGPDAHCSLGEVVPDALSSAGASSATVELRVQVPKDLEAPLGREDMSALLTCLVSNALYAVRGRPGTIDIAAQPTEGGGVRLEVSDNGCGIAAEHLDRVCEPFFTTRFQNGGMGLGLTLVRHLVSAAEGTLRFESVPGHGTRVVIDLPKPVRERVQVAGTALHA